MKRLIFAVCFCFFAVSLNASVVPGRWDKVERLTPGSAVSVRMSHGDRFEGSFESLDSGALVIVDSGGNRLTLPRDAVQEVSQIGVRETRFWTGTKIGALAGFGIGFLIGAAAGDDGIFDDFTGTANGMFLGLVGAGSGALAGYTIDHTGPPSELLYRAARR